MKLSVLLRLTLALAALLLANCAATQSKDKSFLSSYEGFKQDSSFNNRTSYRGDLGKLNNYKGVFLEEVTVARPADMEERKITEADLARLEKTFRTVLETEIKASRFELATRKSADTLSFRAAITEIHPGNPALFGVGYVPYLGTAITATKVTTGKKVGAGAATIEAELLDSITRERFFAIIDENTGTKLNPTSGMSRWGHAELALKKWAGMLRKTIAEQEESPR